ncbi:hypothetical protein ACOSQ4_022354 [Xanthoceras sorbifolium]
MPITCAWWLCERGAGAAEVGEIRLGAGASGHRCRGAGVQVCRGAGAQWSRHTGEQGLGAGAGRRGWA